MAKEESKKSASDDFLEGLSTKMSSMLTESINTAMQNLDLNELGKNLTNTITKGLNDVDVPKILEDKLLKDTKVKKIGEDLKKKVEENLSNLKIKVGDVEIPKQVIDVETKLKTKNLILPKTQLEVPVTYKIPKLNLSKVEDVKVPVKFDVPDKIKLPKADNIVAKVKFDVPNLELPKLEDVKVPVKFNVLDKIKLPKVDDILVNVKYKYSKLNIPEADALQIQVKYKYEKLQLPIVKNISIPVLYEYEKLVLPKNNSLIVDVAYQYKKLILPKVEDIVVYIEYQYEKLNLPKVEDIVAKVNFDVPKLTLPKIDVLQAQVKYKYDKLSLPKVEDIVVSVGYKYNKLILPKADILQVQVKYVYDKLTLPKVDNINVDVSYNYQKLNLPKVDDLIAKVKFTVPKDIKLPKPKDIKVSVNFDVQKLTLPKADDIVAKVKFNVPKDIKLPKVNDILVKVVYQTEQLQLPSKLTLQAVVDKIDTTQAIQTLPIIELKAKLKNIETGEVGELKSMDVKATVTEVDTSLVKKQISDITPTIKLNISDGGTTKNISKDITGTVSAAKDFVNLIIEANKKSKITLDTYNQITSAATKLVQANKMSKAEVDGLLESLKSKLEQKDQVKIGVDTSAVNDIATELTDIKPDVKIKGAIHIDVNSIKSQIKKITPLSIDGILKLDTSELTNLKKENITIGAKLEIDTSESKKIQSTTTPVEQAVSTAPTQPTPPISGGNSAEEMQSVAESMQSTVKNSKEVGENINNLPGDTTLKRMEAFIESFKKSDKYTKATNEQQKEYNRIFDLALKAQKEENLGANDYVKSLQDRKKTFTELNKMQHQQVDDSRLYNKLNTETNKTRRETIKLAQQEGVAGEAARNLLAEEGNLLEDRVKAEGFSSHLQQYITARLKEGVSLQEIYNQEQFKTLLAQEKINKNAEYNNNLQKTNNELAASAIVNSNDALRNLSEEGRQEAINIEMRGKALGYTREQIDEELKSLALKDAVNEKAKEALFYSTSIAEAQRSYNKALKQSTADIGIKELTRRLQLSEEEVSQQARLFALENERKIAAGELTAELEEQIKRNGGLTDQQIEQLKNDNKALRHKREQVELIEHVASYQKQINEEIDKYKVNWQKTKATLVTIFKDPALAKGVLIASAIQGVHKLSEAMHDFQATGMSAGEAVAATFKSLSIQSVLGLSKSADVTKTIAQEYGDLNALTKEQVNSVGKMAVNLGVSGDEATKLTMSMGRMPGMTRELAANSEDMFKSVGKTKGVLPAQIVKEMAKNTGNMAVYSKGGAEGFAKAAASARKMGIELSTILSAAEKTLEYESSVGAQMEASVLLGKEINLDKLRQVSLSGDANAIMEEHTRLIREAGGLDKMNVVQKKALASAMGVSVEEMQKINDQAQFQNKYFGEQSGLMSNLAGYALKYGQAFANGAQQFGPVIAAVISLASNMLMLNAIKATSTGATATDTGATMANTGAKATNTTAIGANNIANAASIAAKNADTAATTANTTAIYGNEMRMKAYKAMRAAGIPLTQAATAAKAMETGATTTNTAATTANASAGGFWNTIKGISNGIMNSSIVLWIREQASMVISTASYYASAAAQGIWNTAKAIGNLLMSTSLGMWVAEKVNIVASTLAKWANVGANAAVAETAIIAGSATAGSGAAAAGASSGFLAFGAALGTFGTLAAPAVPIILAIGAAILLATPALYVLGEVVKSIAVVIGNVLMKAIQAIPTIIDAMARGFVTVFQTLAASWPILLPLSLGLFMLGGALAYVGGTAMIVAPGLLVVSVVLAAAAAAMLATGFAVKMIADAFTQLTSIKTDTVLDFAKAIGILALTAILLAPAAQFMVIGAIGIGALALALVPMADALQKIAAINMGAISQFGIVLFSLAAATAYIGLVSPFILLGAGALILLTKVIDPLSEALAKLSKIKTDNLIDFGKNIMGFAVATAFLGLMSPLILLGSASIFALSLALKPMAEAFKLASEVKPGFLMNFGMAVVGFGAAAAYLGIVSPLIMLGSAAIAVMGYALRPFAESLKMATDLKPDAILTFGKAVGGFAAMAAYLGLVSPLIVLGSVSIGLLGLAMQPVAKAFQMIQGLDFKAVAAFGKTLGIFALATAGLGMLSPLILLGSMAVHHLGMSLIPAAKAFEMVQNLNIKVVEDFGVTLGKFALATAAIGPVAPLMMLGAIGILMLGRALQQVAKAFQMASGIDAKGLELFAYSLGKFSLIAAGLGIIAPLMILGATGIVILGSGLNLIADAFQKVSGLDSKSIENFGFALGKFAAIAAGLGIVSPLILLGSYAILALGAGLSLVADTFIKVSAIDSKKLEEFGLSIGKFAIMAAGLALVSPLILIGAAAIAALGMSLMPFAIALSIAAPASEQMANVLQKLATKETINGLALLSQSLLSVASALGKVGIAGLLALPALGALSILTPTLRPVEAKGATPAAQGVTPTQPPIATGLGTTPTQPPTAVGGPPAPTPATPAATPAQTESGLKELINEIKDLKQIIAKGGKIVMNAKEVGDALRLYGGFDTKAN